jgi:DNA-binding MarR family transcriptional regulator
VAEDGFDRKLPGLLEALPSLDSEVEGAVERLKRIGSFLSRTLEQTAAGHDLTGADWKVLSALRWLGPPYRMPAGQLAQELDITPGTMTIRLDRLEKRGLVTRNPHEGDRRVSQIELTKDGLRAWSDVVEEQAAKEQEFLAQLSERDRKQLNKLLRPLSISIEERAKATKAR